MADAHDETLLTFDQFRARVGAAQHRTRAALLALRLQPVRLDSDRRQLRYRAQWIAPVQQWLRDHDPSDGPSDEYSDGPSDDHTRSSQ